MGSLLIDQLSAVFFIAKFDLSSLGAQIWGFIQVAIGLGFVIFVHELGHFLAAKTFGVRCDKFYVGFDFPISIFGIKLPSTLGKFKWGETEYGIGIIPLGGYVKMLGQDDDPREAEAEAQRIRMGSGPDAPLDPRSYPAKPVWQRMIIISAGVIMNLIFAVLMAAVAFRGGAPYEPTVIGSMLAGGPAWQADMQAGDQIVQVGSMTKEDPYLRFTDFRVQVATHGMDTNGQPMPIKYDRDGKRIELNITPTKLFDPKHEFHLIGAGPQNSTKLGANSPVVPLSYLAEKEVDLQPNDRVIAVDGEQLPIDPRFNQPLGTSLTKRLQAKFNQPVKLTIERQGKDKNSKLETVEVELPAVPVKTLGLSFRPGEIAVIRTGSPAEKAGIKVGDKIVELNGQKDLDALRLPALVAAQTGQQIELGVERIEKEGATAELLKFQFTLSQQPYFDTISPIHGFLSLSEIGVAYDVSPIINQVDKSIAGEVDIQPGDELLQVKWEPTGKMLEVVTENFRPSALKAQVISNDTRVPTIFEQLQSAPVSMKVRCFYRRQIENGTEIKEQELQLKYASDWNSHIRGIALTSLSQTHKTDSMSEALSLGAGETWRRFKEVLGFLRMLVTGKIGFNGVGGPVQIFMVAGAEASHGVPRLLLFLTFLSANLAILNFLPIPALDGGHMMFLIAEAIRGKPVNEDLQVKLTLGGVMCLLGLMLFVIIKDIVGLSSFMQ